MKTFATLLVVFGIAVAPLHAHAAAAPSILEAAELAASSGAYRPQNTATITTGRIGEDDKKRSAIAFAISGARRSRPLALVTLQRRGGNEFDRRSSN